MERHVDRYALVLMDGRRSVPHMDHDMVQTLMQWWLRMQPPLLQHWAQRFCWYCGREPQMHAPSFCSDHAFPDAYAWTPLVPCCLRCNSRKGHATPNESRHRWPGNVYWFEGVGLAASPLGCALREDITGLRAVVFWYLLETNV
jgi:hypothetical protein